MGKQGWQSSEDKEVPSSIELDIKYKVSYPASLTLKPFYGIESPFLAIPESNRVFFLGPVPDSIGTSLYETVV